MDLIWDKPDEDSSVKEPEFSTDKPTITFATLDTVELNGHPALPSGSNDTNDNLRAAAHPTSSHSNGPL